MRHVLRLVFRRARLIWAFFLLAVVPLCGITLYSYLSTERAYRKAVELETTALAEEMNGLGQAYCLSTAM